MMQWVTGLYRKLMIKSARSLLLPPAEDKAVENIVSNFDFSDGVKSWYINFDFCKINVVSTSSGVSPFKGNRYVAVKERTALQQGLEQEITGRIIRDVEYVVTAVVGVSGKIMRDEPATVFLTLKMFTSDNRWEYPRVAMTSVFKGKWEKIEGSFKLHDLPQRIMFYLEGPPPMVDILINFVVISPSKEGFNHEKLSHHQKAFKRMEILVKEYEKFRGWIEDQASNSYGMVKFTEYTPLKIESAMKDTINTIQLGEGGYGRVYKAVIDGRTVAIKKPKAGIPHEDREFKQEVEILRRIRHPNLVTLIGACPQLNAIVYEFLPNGSLADRLFPIKGEAALSWRERIKIAAAICSALVFLHNTKPNPIAHGDLKPDNILFDSSNECKLSDFGISRFLKYTNDTTTPNHDTSQPKGTPSYADPEFVLSGKLFPQADIFAFGIILLQLVTGFNANGLRNYVSHALQNQKLVGLSQEQQGRLVKQLLDSKIPKPPPPTVEVVKMISLGLWCSEPLRKDRPDLESEVCIEIDSMNGFAVDSR